MSTGPALTGWKIVAGEGDSQGECHLRVDEDGAPNTILVLGTGLDGPDLRFGVAADGASSPVEIGDFEVLGREPGRLVGRFTARAVASAPGRLTLAVTVIDGVGASSHHAPVECGPRPLTVTVTGLTLNAGDTPANQLDCGTSGATAASNVALIAGTNLDNSTFALGIPADPSYTLGLPSGVSGSATSLQGTFTAYQTPASPPVSPGPVQLQITITDTISHRVKYKGTYPSSFDVVIVTQVSESGWHARAPGGGRGPGGSPGAAGWPG